MRHRERIWSRLQLWMASKDVAAYAPTEGVNDGTVQVPIRLLRELRDKVHDYEQANGL